HPDHRPGEQPQNLAGKRIPGPAVSAHGARLDRLHDASSGLAAGAPRETVSLGACGALAALSVVLPRGAILGAVRGFLRGLSSWICDQRGARESQIGVSPRCGSSAAGRSAAWGLVVGAVSVTTACPSCR